MNSSAKASGVFLGAIILGFMVLVALPRGVQAQQPETPTNAANSEKEKEAAELKKKTLVLLNDLAAASWSLKLPENRLLIMSGTADLLWAVDQKRARTVYWDALNALNLISSSVRSSEQNLPRAEQLKLLQRYVAVFELRKKLLRLVAKRDAQLALDMLRASRQVPPRAQVGNEFRFPDDSQLEQAIATEFAGRDPAQALQIARQSLAKGLTLEVISLLQRLNDIDSEKGSQFAGEIITKIRTVNPGSDYEASVIAVQLLQESRTRDSQQKARLGTVSGSYANSGGGGGGLKILNLSDDQKRELVEILTDAALTATPKSHVIWHVSVIVPEIEKFFPERQAPLARKLAALRGTQNAEGQEQVNAVNPANGTAEEVLRRAAAADGPTQLGLYYQAAILAIAHGKADWFREVINKEITNSDDRTKVIDLLDSEEISGAAYRKQADRLEKLLPKIRRNEERARAMVELALLLKEKGEDAEAASRLDDAASLIKTDLTDDKQTNALLTLMFAYAVVDPPKAFALAERTIDRANNQISLLLLLDKVAKSGAVKKNEILLEQPNLMPLDFLLFKYGKGVSALANADFGRTRALTERFERNELKLMAQLMLLRSLLDPPPAAYTPGN